MEHFRSYADIYESFDNFPPDTRTGLFFCRLAEMDIGTVHPLLLEVFKRYGRSAEHSAVQQILVDLESFLVRRAVCGLTPKNYNRFFALLVRTLRETSDGISAASIRRRLLSETADTQRWPDDNEFGESWRSVDFYRRIKKSTQRMVLEAIEEALYTEKTEKGGLYQTLTIEHLLPVEWEEHWPLVVKAEAPDMLAQARGHRRDVLHKIGNLSLLTRKLNPSVSNGPWLKKRDAILKHSRLNLNRSFYGVDVWNEEAIEQRSERLLEIALRVWPHPGKLVP